MKNWQQISFLFFILLGSQITFAQRGMSGMSSEEMVKQQMEVMKERLTLSEAQASKVEVVLTTSVEKMQAARESADGDWSSMRETMQAIRMEQKTELQKYLTSDQFVEYEKMEQERMEKRRQRMNGKRDKSKKKEDKT